MRHRYRIGNDVHQERLPFTSADPFALWAKKFFKPHRLNCFIPVSEAFESFVGFSEMPVSRLQFRRALTSWAIRKRFILDPEDLRNGDGRIIRKKEISVGKSVAAEMIYVKTN